MAKLATENTLLAILNALSTGGGNAMVRGDTTPLMLDFTGEDIDFTDASTIEVSFKQGVTKYVFTPTVDSATSISVQLTQEQSLSFSADTTVGPIRVLVTALIDDVRRTSAPAYVYVIDTDNDEVLA